jgi:hypothetical protein
MKRRLFFIAFALCGFTNAKADQVPKFSQFPAREYSRGPTGRLDLSDPHVYSYRTRLREGAQQGANFAGHYTVVTWGCGTDCATGAIIDALTGHVVFLPSVDSNQMEHERDPDFNSFVFRLDSRLIVFAGQLNDQGEKATFFMDFDGKNFRQVYRVIDRGAAEEPQAVEAPTNPGNTPTVRTPVREQPVTVPQLGPAQNAAAPLGTLSSAPPAKISDQRPGRRDVTHPAPAPRSPDPPAPVQRDENNLTPSEAAVAQGIVRYLVPMYIEVQAMVCGLTHGTEDYYTRMAEITNIELSNKYHVSYNDPYIQAYAMAVRKKVEKEYTCEKLTNMIYPTP